MNKMEYTAPETEILEFGTADVITISVTGEGDEVHELIGP